MENHVEMAQPIGEQRNQRSKRDLSDITYVGPPLRQLTLRRLRSPTPVWAISDPDLIYNAFDSVLGLMLDAVQTFIQ